MKLYEIILAAKKTTSQMYQGSTINNESGFALVLTMVVLVVLTLIGVSSTNKSTIELFISGNDRIHKETFYQADGGTELGARMVFDNAICVQVNGGFNQTEDTNTRIFDDFIVYDLDFSSVQSLPPNPSISDASGERAVSYYPGGRADTNPDENPHTNILTQGQIKVTPGSGLQMISGYEGLGASSIGGGTQIDFDIISQHQGVANSESVITVGWRMSTHMINSASSQDCNTNYTN